MTASILRQFLALYFAFCLFDLLVCKAYAVLRAANRFVGSESPKRNAFDQFQKGSFQSNSSNPCQVKNFRILGIFPFDSLIENRKFQKFSGIARAVQILWPF